MQFFKSRNGIACSILAWNALNDLLLRLMAVTWVQAAAKPLSTMPRLIGSPRLRFQDDRSRPLAGNHDIMRFGAVSQIQNR